MSTATERREMAEDKLAVMWNVFGMAILAAAAGMLLAFILSPKKVDGYYLSRGGANAMGNVCVYAHWTWHSDELAFCTDRYADALEFATKANASIK